MSPHIQVLPYSLELCTASLYTDIFFPIFESACHFSYCASIFIVIILTVERCQAVCFPYWYQEKVRRQTVRTITLQLVTPVVLLALLFNITKFIAISPLGTSSS